MNRKHVVLSKLYWAVLYTSICSVLYSSCGNAEKVKLEEPRLSVQDNGEWIELKDGQKEGIYLHENGRIFMEIYEGDSKDLLKEADMSTFRVCKGSQYAKDKNHVYYPLAIVCFDGIDRSWTRVSNYIIDSADPTTFKYIGNTFSETTSLELQFAADSIQMYRDGERIEWDNEIIRSNGQRTSYLEYYEGFDGLDSVYRVKYIDR